MAICTVDDVKLYLGVDGSGDDGLITDLITRAQKAIETRTGRVFDVSSDTTLYYTVGEDTDGPDLYFDRELAAITSIYTNFDNGTGGTQVTTSDYKTMPINGTPYYGVKILGSSSLDWEYTNDPEGAIRVIGKVGYSTTPPADIKHACVRLAGFYYRQKDSQVFDTQAFPEAGMMTVPTGFPRDVAIVLDNYIRVVE